ncbi:unnamed protein product [Gadus morhua 'NCC']
MYIFWHTIILAVVNAWLLYKRDCKALKDSLPPPLDTEPCTSAAATWQPGDGPEVDCLQESRPLGAEEVEVEDGEQEALDEREEAGDAGLQ